MAQDFSDREEQTSRQDSGDFGKAKRFLNSLTALRLVRWEPKGVPVKGASEAIETCEGTLYLFLTKEAFDASFR